MYCVTMAQIELTGLGKRVAKLRRANKISAQKLAEETGLTRSVITNIENERKTDPTISEVLAISRALRVPLAAILYDIEKPLLPAHELDDDDLFATRVVDAIDQLNRAESEAEDNEELLAFQAEVNDLDAVVVYPIGLSVYSTYSKAGQTAVALIEAGRALAKASSREESARHDFFVVLREAINPKEELPEDQDILDSGYLADSDLVRRASARLSSSDKQLLDKQARKLDRASNELKRAKDNLRALGGDPSSDYRGASLWRAMSLVQSMPHEALQETKARGELLDGAPKSPLRVRREERLAQLRAQMSSPETRGE